MSVDAADAAKNYAVDAVVDALDTDRLRQRNGDIGARTRAVRAEACRDLDPRALRFLDAVSYALPDDANVVCDMCILGYSISGFHGFHHPRKLQYPMGPGTLGFAFPAALGTSLAGTGPTVSISGDGGFLFACGELATMAQEQLPFTAVIVDDGGYGMLRYDQVKAGEETFGVDLEHPDFAMLAESFGVRAETVEGLDDAFGEALAGHVPIRPRACWCEGRGAGPPPTTSPNWYRRNAGAGRLEFPLRVFAQGRNPRPHRDPRALPACRSSARRPTSRARGSAGRAAPARRPPAPVGHAPIAALGADHLKSSTSATALQQRAGEALRDDVRPGVALFAVETRAPRNAQSPGGRAHAARRRARSRPPPSRSACGRQRPARPAATRAPQAQAPAKKLHVRSLARARHAAERERQRLATRLDHMHSPTASPAIRLDHHGGDGLGRDDRQPARDERVADRRDDGRLGEAGLIAFNRMPSAASPGASDRTSPTTACLLAE